MPDKSTYISQCIDIYIFIHFPTATVNSGQPTETPRHGPKVFPSEDYQLETSQNRDFALTEVGDGL
jgi:hypothetical protein